MGRREEKKRAKRRRLEAEGLKLFLDQGYDKASIEQIAAAAEVARGTFYLYYSDKLALFETLVDRWFEPMFEVLQEVHDQLSEATTRAQSLEIYQQMGAGLALLGITHSDVVLMGFRESRHAGEAGERLRAREMRLQEAVFELTALAKERGLITADDPKLTGLVILGAVERLYYEFLVGADLGDPQELATNVVTLFAKVLELPG